LYAAADPEQTAGGVVVSEQPQSHPHKSNQIYNCCVSYAAVWRPKDYLSFGGLCMSSLRPERAQRRAAKLRNQRIILGAAILLVLGAIGFLAYTALSGPDRNAPVATETAAAGEPGAANDAAIGELTTTAS